jgi:hypothetical protein
MPTVETFNEFRDIKDVIRQPVYDEMPKSPAELAKLSVEDQRDYFKRFYENSEAERVSTNGENMRLREKLELHESYLELLKNQSTRSCSC